MKPRVYEIHERLKACPPAHLLYIIYRRLIEHGLGPMWLWIQDKLVRRAEGYSPPYLSQVAPHLYVGGQHTEQGLKAMKDHGIHAVLNMREEFNDADHGRAPRHYLWLPIVDDTAPTREDLERGAAFIQRHVEQGHGVYVHCAAGVGRAPTMAAAYLVRQGATPEEAWSTLRRGRPFIRPTPPQLDAIRAYAESRHRSSSPVSRGKADPGTQSAAPSDRDPERREDADDLEERVERAFEHIAGDAGLTADLTDDQAKALLSWAESEVRRLVQSTRGMDEARAWATLDPQLAVLRRHLREVARRSARTDHPMETLRANLSAPDYPNPDAT